jgi:hypothetical protein
MASVIAQRQKGVAIELAVEEAFKPQENPTPAGTPAEVSPEGQPVETPAGGGLPMGMSESGRMQGVAPGQIAPGGRPDIQSLLASLTSRGEPNLQASLVKRIPVG